MNILATQYTLATKSFEIYISGCAGNPHCKGCHNPDSWDFNLGEKYNKDYFINHIKSKIDEFDLLIKNIMIFGGEPLDNNHDEVFELLSDLKSLNKHIWLFTRYDLNNVPDKIKNVCDYIKCGRYIPELSTENNTQYGIKLATSNQNIYKKGIDFNEN